MAKKPFSELVRERAPNFYRIEAAFHEFESGRPVTQRTVDTNEPIFITEDRFLGVTYVTAGTRLLTRLKFPPNHDLRRDEATSVSTFVDPDTGETLTLGQPERRESDKVSTDRHKHD